MSTKKTPSGFFLPYVPTRLGMELERGGTVSVPIKSMTENQLREVGEAWANELIEKAGRIRGETQ